MKIQKNVSLKDFTTLKLGGVCTDFCVVDFDEQLPFLIDWGKSAKKRLLVLGGGSNLVLNDHLFDGLVLKIEIQGIQIIKYLSGHVVLRVGAGVNWDEFVEHTVEHGYWGAENMSLIPGTVGAIPVQNVGAYGQEASRIIAEVNVFDRVDEKFRVLTNSDCQFSWRHSIFNTTHKNRYIITTVDFKLATSPKPNLKRLVLQKTVDDLKVKRIGADDEKNLQQSLIRKAVITLRTSGRNLPNRETDYNTGTFFPVNLVNKNNFYSVFFKILSRLGLKAAFKVLACRIKFIEGEYFKLPSNLLINSCGCKNIASKNFKLFENNQAVLIHNGKGSAEEFIEYIDLIRDCVFKKTGILIPIEPEIISTEKEV